MKKNITLQELLKTQDLGEKAIDSICEKVLNNSFDVSKDLFTAFLVETFKNAESGTDLDKMEMDLSYYISQLTRAKVLVEQEEEEEEVDADDFSAFDQSEYDTLNKRINGTIEPLAKLTAPENTSNTAVVTLSSCGNPDKRQYAAISSKRIEPCTTFEDAVKHCNDYIQDNDLGGGNWNAGHIMHPTKGIIARVSYNGRVWESNGCDDVTMDRKEITDLKASIINFHN